MTREFIEHLKASLGVPIDKWLRATLGAWVRELLHPDTLSQERYLRTETTTHVWQQHISGRYDHTTKLWSVLIWQPWIEQWG